MSRVAKKPVAIAKGVELNVQPELISVKGPKGTLSVIKPVGIEVNIEDGNAQLSANDASLVPLTGTLRAIVANMVKGVSEGFERKLELVGVGYRAAMQGKDLNLSLGFSHPVLFVAPEGITLSTPTQTEVLVQGTDKQMVGEMAARIRALRVPDPYKAKGIKYAEERIKKKAGKAGKVGAKA